MGDFLLKIPEISTGRSGEIPVDLWVTGSSRKAPYWEMRAFAGREKQPQSGALGTANPQFAS